MPVGKAHHAALALAALQRIDPKTANQQTKVGVSNDEECYRNADNANVVLRFECHSLCIRLMSVCGIIVSSTM